MTDRERCQLCSMMTTRPTDKCCETCFWHGEQIYCLLGKLLEIDSERLDPKTACCDRWRSKGG